jgi:hypothetical protein
MEEFMLQWGEYDPSRPSATGECPTGCTYGDQVAAYEDWLQREAEAGQMTLAELLAEMREQARKPKKGRRENPTGSLRKDALYTEIADLLRRMPSDWKRQYRSGRDKLAAIGGPVLPDTPSPEQAMLLIGITAGGNPSKDTPFGPHKVPKAVRDAAMKGIRLSHANNYGAWDFIGLARAIELVIVPSVSDTSFSRMGKYLFRHKKDASASGFGDDARPSRGYMAWLNWGGDPAVSWTRAFERNPAADASEAISAEALTVPKAAKTLPAKAVAVDLSSPPKDPPYLRVLLLRADALRKEKLVPSDVLGYGTAAPKYIDPEDGYKIGVAAAEPGYGYLLYALLADLAGPNSLLFGSSSQTQYAKRFWAKQPGGYVRMLTPAEFKAQFGVASADVLFKGGERALQKAKLGRARSVALHSPYPEDDRTADMVIRGSLESLGNAYFSDYYAVSTAASSYLGPQYVPRPVSPREGVERLEKATQYLRWPDLALVPTEKSDLLFSGYLVRAPKGRSVFGPEDVLAKVYGNVDTGYFMVSGTPRFERAPERAEIVRELGTLVLPRRSLKVRNALKRGKSLSAALVTAGFPDETTQAELLRYLKQAAETYDERRLYGKPLALANPGFPLYVRITMPNPSKAEEALSSVRTGHTVASIGRFATKKAAPRVAARVAATTAGKFGARAVPLVGEALIVVGAGKEAYKVGKRRYKEGLRSGSVTRDVAKVAAGAFGLEDFVPEAKKNPRRRRK